MSAPQTGLRTIYCDGCTVEATQEHLRRRIARLEWASRYRPIHISTLILTPAPPAALEDFFYAPEGLPKDPEAAALHQDLMSACEVTRATENWEKALGLFQHAGFFLAEAVECPVEEGTDFNALVAHLTPTLVRRVQFSYRPKCVLVLSEILAPVANALREAQTGAELLGPVSLPSAGDVEGRERFRKQLTQLLQQGKVG
jgi:hypothetical protein